MAQLGPLGGGGGELITDERLLVRLPDRRKSNLTNEGAGCVGGG